MTTNNRVPVQKRGIKTKKRIIATARRLFGKVPFHKVTLEDIGKAAGSKGAVTYHFDSKESLIKEVVSTILQERPDLQHFRKRVKQRVKDPDARILLDHMLDQ